MAHSIEISDNIKECLEIIDSFVQGKTEKDEAENALNYLKVTVDNAARGTEPKGCPSPRKVETVAP